MSVSPGGSILDSYFTPGITSIHIKTNSQLIAKHGDPAHQRIIHQGEPRTENMIKILIQTLYDEIATNHGLIEIQRKYSTVAQLGSYRIVIVCPPAAQDYEITVVKPLKKLDREEYHLGLDVQDLLEHHAQGILISGAPGSGKSTFTQALLQQYLKSESVVKTIEAPRDMQVHDTVSQYSSSHTTHDEIRDILLLSRPDKVIYDELRNTSDFQLYKDLRLTGIGLVGVMHATAPIDTVQRLIGIIPLGMIPQVVDTIIFIDKGQVSTIYQLISTIKIPTGMEASDLARPVIQVKNFASGQIVYELYSFGEQIVVMPLSATSTTLIGLKKLAAQYLQHYLADIIQAPYGLCVYDDHITLYLDRDEKASFIGRQGEHIHAIEQELTMKITVKILDEDELPPEALHCTPLLPRKPKRKFRYR